ncbi:hypothetical protein HanRHA438_Chr09g0425631 [Helianthus annuus]|nr:hypothetical protein HanRHA438_Chr09g0425631 [Helianthus annuus]
MLPQKEMIIWLVESVQFTVRCETKWFPVRFCKYIDVVKTKSQRFQTSTYYLTWQIRERVKTQNWLCPSGQVKGQLF